MLLRFRMTITYIVSLCYQLSITLWRYLSFFYHDVLVAFFCSFIARIAFFFFIPSPLERFPSHYQNIDIIIIYLLYYLPRYLLLFVHLCTGTYEHKHTHNGNLLWEEIYGIMLSKVLSVLHNLHNICDTLLVLVRTKSPLWLKQENNWNTITIKLSRTDVSANVWP